MRKTLTYQLAPGKSTLLLPLALLLSAGFDVAAQQKPSEAPGPPAKVQAQASKTIVDDSIPADPTLETIVKPYSARVRELEVVIGKLEGELRKGGLGAGSLGNFATDGMRAAANRKLSQPVDLAITNGGGLRKNTFWPGELRVLDIFELVPFENQLFTLELSGDQLLKVLQFITAGREAQSGARIRFRVNEQKKTELVSATLMGADGKERPIDPAATYRVVTVDYLLSVEGRDLSILAKGKNIKPLGISMREALIAYVKAETAAGRVIKSNLDGRFSSR